MCDQLCHSPRRWGDKHTIDSDAHRDASDAEAIVPDVRRGVLNTNFIVSDIHHKLKSREGVDGRNQAASVTRALPVHTE